MAVRPGDDYDDSTDTQGFTCKSCKRRQPLTEYYATLKGHRHECKTCIRKRRKQRYHRDPERYVAYSVQWNRDNRDRHNEIHRASYRRNRPSRRERLRRWRQENPEKYREQQDRAAALEARRGYPNAHKRRALAHGAFVEHVDKRIVYEACEGLCAICEEPIGFKEATLDHIVPLARGGEHCYENIQIAHGYCNRRKGVKLMEELDDDLRYASAPKEKKPYLNSRGYRNSQSKRAA